jgi:hypothetical protein
MSIGKMNVCKKKIALNNQEILFCREHCNIFGENFSSAIFQIIINEFNVYLCIKYF